MRSPNPPARLSGALALLASLTVGCANRPSTTGETPDAHAGVAPAGGAQPAPTCDSARTQLELTACRAEAARQAETLESTRYAEAVEALKRKGTAEQAGALAASEQKWKDYRDAQCQAAAGLYAGGSGGSMVAADCRARLADARAAELKIVHLDWAAR